MKKDNRNVGEHKARCSSWEKQHLLNAPLEIPVYLHKIFIG